MTYKELEEVISRPRLNRYTVACKKEKRKAVVLYRYNLMLSQKFFAILSIFEVTLRNKIDEHYRNIFSDDNWLETQCQDTGFFSNKIFEEGGYVAKTKIQEIAKDLKAKNKYNHDRLVAALTFGFWVYLFNSLHFRAGGQSIHKIFIEREKNTNQKKIFKELYKINVFRNRIAHFEPICFNKSHEIDTGRIEKYYQLVIKYLTWLGYNPQRLFYGIDHIDSAINKVKSFKQNLSH